MSSPSHVVLTEKRSSCIYIAILDGPTTAGAQLEGNLSMSHQIYIQEEHDPLSCLFPTRSDKLLYQGILTPTVKAELQTSINVSHADIGSIY